MTEGLEEDAAGQLQRRLLEQQRLQTYSRNNDKLQGPRSPMALPQHLGQKIQSPIMQGKLALKNLNFLAESKVYRDKLARANDTRAQRARRAGAAYCAAASQAPALAGLQGEQTRNFPGVKDKKGHRLPLAVTPEDVKEVSSGEHQHEMSSQSRTSPNEFVSVQDSYASSAPELTFFDLSNPSHLHQLFGKLK